jgi:hypothetical protein
MNRISFPSRLRHALPLAAACIGSYGLLGQAIVPGTAEDNGLQPIGDTVYVNPQDGFTINNGQTESIGVGIARNGNVIVGWEDDGSDLTDLQATWTLFNGLSESITPDTDIVSIDPTFAGLTLNSRFLSYFRANGSATPARTSWGPKIKANLFGNGIGMGATSFELGLEVPALLPIENNADGENAGDYPTVQLLDNNGAPIGILSGVTDAYAERPGNIRIGDWDYLSNGNIVIVGESRQSADLVSVYGGEANANHVIVRILTPAGVEVKAIQLVSDSPTRAEMWHGVASTRNGFAVRFAGPDNRGKLRFFNNAGDPVGGNVDLDTAVGNPLAGNGGRGDGVGFHGNGNDAYALVTMGSGVNGPTVLVTVFNADGSVRWSKVVSDDLQINGPGRGDVAIDSLGRVAVVYDDTAATGGFARGIIGRVFKANGDPVGGSFYISEREIPSDLLLESRNPRIAFRNDTIAAVWESRNADIPDVRTVGFRQFVVPVKPGSIEAAGLSRIVPDTLVINQGLDALGNWEPYASVLGTSTFLIEANAYAQDTFDMQRYVVAFQPAAGGAARLGEAVFADNGTPFRGPVNASRQNGNPGRVGGDPRPGAVNFVAGGEMSPHTLPEFNSNNRWNTGFNRTTETGVESRYGTVQPFRLDTTTLEQTPLALAFDVANGRLSQGVTPSAEHSRFGGDIVGLGNGNFVVSAEDRSRTRRLDGNCAVATIIAPNGSIVKETFHVADGDFWSNTAAFQGGFVLRVQGVLYFYDNDGNPLGSVNQSVSGESFDPGRGDGTRIAGHVNHPYVFLAGKVTTGPIIRVAVFDARTRTFVTSTEVSEGGFRGDFNRANLAVDALGRTVVSWVARPDGYEVDQVAARVLALENGTTLRALTPSFLAFINQAPTGGIRTFQMSLAMTTRQILVAAKGEINLANKPELGATSFQQANFYTVISHPNPAEDPTPSAVASTPITTAATRSATGVALSWTGGNAPFKVQKRNLALSGDWMDVLTTSDRTAEVVPEGDAGFYRVVGQ